MHLDGLDRRAVNNAVVGGHLVERAILGAFGAVAVVAADINDERVVELAHVLDLLNHPANLVVGIGHIGGKDFSLAGIEFLLDQRERVPPGQLGPTKLGLSVRPRREFSYPPESRRAASGWRRSLRATFHSPCRTCL